MSEIICGKCNIPLEEGKTYLSYLGNEFQIALPRCPNCGQVFVDEELVRGKMREVEMALEDK